MMVFENKLYVQLDKKTNSKLLVLNTATGDTIKTIARNDMTSWASPVIFYQKGQEPQLIVNANPYTISYNLNSDTENWRTECLTGDVAPSIAYFKDRIFTTNTRDALFCLDASTGKIIWESYDPVLPDTASPVVTKDFLFMATAPGVVSCINTADGSILWEKEFHHLFYSSPILADNKIFVTSRKGKTHIFEAIGEYTPISEPQLFEEVVATPAFIKDKIVMRTKKHLYLIGEK